MSRAPDGNGGLYRALRVDGILDHMTSNGVKYIQLYCVDNILVKVGDPVFSGYCITKGAECANKVVPKGAPNESVGITCMVDGKYQVIKDTVLIRVKDLLILSFFFRQVVEYSEITNKAAEMRNSDGSLTYSAANICNHFFTLDFLQKVVNQHERELVHHIAKKKIPFVDEATGELVKPERPNGIKMEKFVFDVFRFADSFVIWECVREEEFAPLKNANGASDSTPAHCRKALFALHMKYVLAAGGTIVDEDGKKLPQMVSPAAQKENNNNNNGQAVDPDLEVVCELAPKVTFAGEGLEKHVKGKTFKVPVVDIGL